MQDEDRLLDYIRELLDKKRSWREIAYAVHYQDPKYTAIVQKFACKDVALMQYVAELGFFKAMVFLHGRGCPWDEEVCNIAAKRGMFVCLKYAIENGCPWNRRNVCYQAALSGHLNCLRYACEHGGECNEDTAAIAALNDTTDCLEYLYDHGCPWNERVCINAAWGGKLHNLKFAHENGCPWNETVITQALSCTQERYDCVRYALIHGCPVAEAVQNMITDDTPKDIQELMQCRHLLQKLIISSSNLLRP